MFVLTTPGISRKSCYPRIRENIDWGSCSQRDVFISGYYMMLKAIKHLHVFETDGRVPICLQYLGMYMPIGMRVVVQGYLEVGMKLRSSAIILCEGEKSREVG